MSHRAGQHGWSLQTRRDAWEALVESGPVPEDVEVLQASFGDRPGETIALRAEPPRGTILFLHGGGFTRGSPRTHRRLAVELARRMGCVVHALDYRLAPEQPGPAAMEDTLAALETLQPVLSRVALVGGSAGGGLALASLVAAHKRGLGRVRCAWLLSPWIDMTLDAGSMRRLQNADFILTREELAADARAYLGGADPRSPQHSPRLADLAGLPPLFVQAGGAELLVDDAVALAGLAASAGADVALEVAAGMPHIWAAFVDQLPEAGKALDRGARWLAAHDVGRGPLPPLVTAKDRP